MFADKPGALPDRVRLMKRRTLFATLALEPIMKRRAALVAACLSSLFLSSRAASAQESTDTSKSSSEHRTWYGWQSLIADGISGASLAAGLVTFSAQGSHETALPSIFLGVGLGGSILGAPIVHFAHGKVGTGFASLGIRCAGWLMLALGSSESGGSAGAGIAGGVALLTAVALDASVFGYEVDRPASKSALVVAPMWRRTMKGVAATISF